MASDEEQRSAEGPGDDQTYLTLKDVAPKLEKLWFLYPRLLQLNLFLMGGLLSQVVCGYDGSMINSLLSVQSFEDFFNNPHGAILGTMSNGMTIGNLIMVPFVSHIVDYLGRRWSIIVGCLVIVVGAVIQGCAQSFGMFVGGRILLGVGGIVSLTASPPLVTECAFPTQRPVVTAFLMPSWPFGALIAALVTWAPYLTLYTSNWAWRIPSLLQLFFPAVQLVMAFFGPESPRWLIDKGRESEARAFFVKYHAFGDENHPIIAYEMAEITAAIEEEKSQKIGSWLSWFRSKKYFHIFALCLAVPAFQQLSGNALISYYLEIILNNTGITDRTSQLKINLGLSAWTLICSIAGSLLVGGFKRRTLFLTGYACMFFVYIAFTGVSAGNAEKNFLNKGLGDAVVFFIFLYNMVYQICSPIAFTYTMEICPYSMRSKGSLLYQFSGAIVGFFNNYVNPIAMVAITWKYYIVYIIWLAVQFTIVFFFFPETAGHDLEGIAGEVFGDDTGRAAIERFHNKLDEKVVVEHSETV